MDLAQHQAKIEAAEAALKDHAQVRGTADTCMHGTHLELAAAVQMPGGWFGVDLAVVHMSTPATA